MQLSGTRGGSRAGGLEVGFNYLGPLLYKAATTALMAALAHAARPKIIVSTFRMF